MSWRHYVLIAMGLAAAFLLAAEIVALFNDEPGDTITSIVRSSVQHHPMIAVVWGCLTAHFFWIEG